MGLKLGEKERPVKSGDSFGPARAEVVTEPSSLDYFPTDLSVNYAQRVLFLGQGILSPSHSFLLVESCPHCLFSNFQPYHSRY